MIGLYGVMSYTVARRTREIGVRVALGATRRSISWLVIREVLVDRDRRHRPGAARGVVARPVCLAQLYGVEPRDPLTTRGTVTLLVLVCLAAGLVPSVRAARLSPTVALRVD